MKLARYERLWIFNPGIHIYISKPPTAIRAEWLRLYAQREFMKNERAARDSNDVDYGSMINL